MSDPKSNGNNGQNPMQLVISFDGQRVSVNGPIDNTLLCFRMMGLAMQMMVDHMSKKKQLEVV